jgi:hypothetical protein
LYGLRQSPTPRLFLLSFFDPSGDFFLMGKRQLFPICLRSLVPGEIFFKGSGGSTVRIASSRSITTSTMSPGFTPAPSRRLWFTGIM